MSFISAQITGKFALGDDDKVYFECYNGSGFNIPITTLVLVSKSNQKTTLNSSGWWNGGTKFRVGPNLGWSWEKGEQIHVYTTMYGWDGRPYENYIGYWTCPIDNLSTWDKIMDWWDKKPRVPTKGLGKGMGSKALKFLKKIR